MRSQDPTVSHPPPLMWPRTTVANAQGPKALLPQRWGQKVQNPNCTVASGSVTPWASQSSQQSGQNIKVCPGSGRGGHLLGTRLMARRGRSTRTVRMAERLTLCPSREYSIMLGRAEEGVQVVSR